MKLQIFLKQPFPKVASGVVLSDYGVTRDYRDKGRDDRGCFSFRPGDVPRAEGPAAVAARAGLLSLLVAAKLISEDGTAMALFAQEGRWAKKDR